jgi:hypothetical protein
VWAAAGVSEVRPARVLRRAGALLAAFLAANASVSHAALCPGGGQPPPLSACGREAGGAECRAAAQWAAATSLASLAVSPGGGGWLGSGAGVKARRDRRDRLTHAAGGGRGRPLRRPSAGRPGAGVRATCALCSTAWGRTRAPPRRVRAQAAGGANCTDGAGLLEKALSLEAHGPGLRGLPVPRHRPSRACLPLLRLDGPCLAAVPALEAAYLRAARQSVGAPAGKGGA